MKKKTSSWLWVCIFVVIPFIYTLLVYDQIPATIPTHFNIKGEADGWGPRENIFLLPAIMAVVSIFVYGLLSNLKKIDPKRYEKSDSGYFRNFGVYTVLFLSILSLTITYSSIHPNTISINRLIFPVLGIGFAGLGLYMPKIPQNYFVGIRLAWTLESTENWDATHEFGGKIWLAGGLSIIATSFLFKPEIFGIIFLIIIAIMVLMPVIYSYRMYRSTKKASS